MPSLAKDFAQESDIYEFKGIPLLGQNLVNRLDSVGAEVIDYHSETSA